MTHALTPLEGSARRIKNRLDAHAVNVVFLEDDKNPDAICIMAEFKADKRTRYYTHVEPMPLRRDWVERAVANLKRESERA